jgi:hypothetical protein
MKVNTTALSLINLLGSLNFGNDHIAPYLLPLLTPIPSAGTALQQLGQAREWHSSRLPLELDPIIHDPPEPFSFIELLNSDEANM